MQDTKISDKWKLSSPATIKNVWKPKKKKRKEKKRWHAPWDKIQEQPRVRYENKTSVKQQKLAEVLLRGQLISLFNLVRLSVTRTNPWSHHGGKHDAAFSNRG